MNRLTMKDWEKKYIVEPIERMDQKNIGFTRARWDTTLVGEKGFKDWGHQLYGLVMPREKAGYTLQDMALQNASWWLELGFAEGNAAGRTGLFAWDSKQMGVSRPPEGLKIDINNPQKITRHVKNVAKYFGADLVGVCELDRRWIYSHWYNLRTRENGPLEIPKEYKYAIVMAHEMDYELEKYAPTRIADAATGMGYTKMAFTAGLLAQFIRGIGYKAIPNGNDTGISIPMALQAGLGELSRSGLLVTREYGPRVRISKVLTDLPLVVDQPIEFGVTEFCSKCALCADACPGQAIIHGERTIEPHNVSNVRGELKWPVDAEKCFKFWAINGTPCTVCIRVCPFNKHMNWFHRISLWLVDYARWGDSFYRKMDGVLGYGKQKEAKDFWDIWRPRQALRITKR
jgi:epoxyqueuosine reductase